MWTEMSHENIFLHAVIKVSDYATNLEGTINFWTTVKRQNWQCEALSHFYLCFIIVMNDFISYILFILYKFM